MAHQTLRSLRPEIHVKAAILGENGTDYTSCAPERAVGIGRNDSAESLEAAIADAVGCAINVKAAIAADHGTDDLPCVIARTTGVSGDSATQVLKASPTDAGVDSAVDVEGMIRAEHGTNYFLSDAGRATRVLDHGAIQPQKAAPGGAVTGVIDIKRVIHADDGTDHAPGTIIGTAGIFDNHPAQG